MKRFVLAAVAAASFAGVAQAEADLAAGEKAFKKCMACHSVADKTNKVGPYLMGVVGRTPGTVEGYKYSEAMTAFGAGGAVWDEATLDGYIKDPKGFVPKNKMTFAGVKKDDERANLIAFLKSKPAQ